MIAQDIIDRAAELLHDRTNVRWTVPELLRNITDAQRLIVLVRPDANPVRSAVRLVGGRRQTIPTGGVRFQRVVRNLGAAGDTPGRNVTQVSRATLDQWSINWGAPPTSATVEHYVFDRNEPKAFDVYPSVKGVDGVDADTYVELVYTDLPDAVEDADDELTLTDEWLSPVLDLVMWRCYSKDSETADFTKAATYAASAAQTLGVTQQALAAAGNSNDGETA